LLCLVKKQTEEIPVRAGVLILKAFLCIVTTILALPSFAESSEFLYGVRAGNESSVVFVKCQLAIDTKRATGCVDISNSWPVDVFKPFLEGSLKEAKANALFRAGIFAGLSTGSAFYGLRTYRNLREFEKFATIELNAPYAQQVEYYEATKVATSRYFNKAIFPIGAAGDLGRLLGIGTLGATALLTLAVSGDTLLDYVHLSQIGSASDLLFDQLNRRNVFVFKNDTGEWTADEEQEKGLQTLLLQMYSEIGT
jgi:hypothetical protein